MRSLMLVANPAASGFTAALYGDIVRILESGYRVEAAWPDGPHQARDTAAGAARDGYDVVVAMGGDGVAHQVANGLHGSTTALGIVPAGTTNVLQRLLGMPRRPRQAAEAIIAARGEVRHVRTLRLDTIGPAGRDSRVATFAAGVGFDAEVIRESERRPLAKVGLGSFHYARSALRVAAAFRDRLDTLRVEDADERADAVGVMVQVHDEYTFLGNRPMRLGPPPGPMAASVRRVRPLRVVRVVMRGVLRRRIDGVGGVRLWRGFTALTVRAEPDAWLEADGEVIGQVSQVTMTPAEAGLLVVGGEGAHPAAA